MKTDMRDVPPLSLPQQIGYGALICIGIAFGFVSFGALGNILGWLAIYTGLGFVIVPSYALFKGTHVKHLPQWARVVFWLSVLTAVCFIILIALLVFALRNNFR